MGGSLLRRGQKIPSWLLVALALGVIGSTSSLALAEEQDCSLSLQGCFLDLDGDWKRAGSEYDRRLQNKEPFHLLTIAELSLILGGAITWYAADRERNLADWDYPSWKQRFTLEAWTFDNNQFPINFIGHPVNGSLFYLFPRANDHSLWVSSGYAFATSFVWEFFAEFKEKVSVNDLIVTFGAGITMGEFGHKFTRYFAGKPAKSTTSQKVANATLGFPVSLRRLLSGQPQSVEGPYDEYGFSNHIGPRLAAGYLYRQHAFSERGLENTVATHGLKAGGRLTSVPGEGRPGEFSLFFHDADITELWLSAGGGAQAREFELKSDTHLLGLYAQRLDAMGQGVSGVVSLNLAYRYLFQDFNGYNDRLGLVRMPGLGGDFRYTDKNLGISTRLRVNPDFAGLHAPAYGAWRDLHLDPDDLEKTILRKHGYYFAWGASTRAGLSVTLGPLAWKGDLEIGTYRSQQGLDRNQGDITVDVDARDSLVDFYSGLSLRIPTTPFRLDLDWAQTRRKSRLGSYASDRRLTTWSLGVSLLR